MISYNPTNLHSLEIRKPFSSRFPNHPHLLGVRSCFTFLYIHYIHVTPHMSQVSTVCMVSDTKKGRRAYRILHASPLEIHDGETNSSFGPVRFFRRVLEAEFNADITQNGDRSMILGGGGFFSPSRLNKNLRNLDPSNFGSISFIGKGKKLRSY